MIAFGGATDGGSNAGTADLTFSVTVSGSSTILYVAARVSNAGVETGVTYNGVAMTQIGSTVTLSDFAARFSLWRLINPASGTHNVVINANQPLNIQGNAVFYTGVKQAGFPDAGPVTNTQAGGLNTNNNTVTSIANNCWHIAMGVGSNITAGTNTVLRVTTGGIMSILDGNAAITPAGSNTVQFTVNTAQNTSIGVTMAPAPELSDGLFLVSD